MTKSQEQLNEQAEVAPTIWKYELELEQRQTITILDGTEPTPEDES